MKKVLQRTEKQLEKHWSHLRKNDNWKEVWKFISTILKREIKNEKRNN